MGAQQWEKATVIRMQVKTLFFVKKTCYWSNKTLPNNFLLNIPMSRENRAWSCNRDPEPGITGTLRLIYKFDMLVFMKYIQNVNRKFMTWTPSTSQHPAGGKFVLVSMFSSPSPADECRPKAKQAASAHLCHLSQKESGAPRESQIHQRHSSQHGKDKSMLHNHQLVTKTTPVSLEFLRVWTSKTCLF